MVLICDGNNCPHCNGEAVPLGSPPYYEGIGEHCTCKEDNFSPCPRCRRRKEK